MTALTVLLLSLSRKLRSRDASKFHVQLCLALLGMLVVFAAGINRTEVFGVCVTVSMLIHYFTLVAVMWMGAEALLTVQKLVIVFVQITTRYIIGVSLVCWCKLFICLYTQTTIVLSPHYSGPTHSCGNFCCN